MHSEASKRAHEVGLKPSDTTIGDFDFVPSIGRVEEGHLGAFVQHKEVNTGLIGRAFHRHSGGHHDGLVLLRSGLFELCGKRYCPDRH